MLNLLKASVVIPLVAVAGLIACSTPSTKSSLDEIALPIARKNNCLACHGVGRKIVGPAFTDVAARYRGQDAQGRMFRKVRNGGSGVWGAVPEPPNPIISDADLRLLIRWIMEMDVTPERSSWTANQASTRAENSPVHNSCTVTVTQGGKAAPSRQFGRVPYYSLKKEPFRIEVTSTECEPSLGVFLNVDDFKYVVERPVVSSTIGFEMSGSRDTSDILLIRSETPRVSEELGGLPSAKDREALNKLCGALGSCPQPIRAFRTYWSFVDAENGEKMSYANIKRLAEGVSIDRIENDIPVVVYTKAGHSSYLYNNSILQNAHVLRTHPIVLRFR